MWSIQAYDDAQMWCIQGEAEMWSIQSEAEMWSIQRVDHIEMWSIQTVELRIKLECDN